MGGSEVAGSGNSASPPRSSSARSIAAILLLAAPFLWAIASLALAGDPDDRAGQLLFLWPHLLILAVALAVTNLRPSLLLSKPGLTMLLPFILIATIHGAFLSQQLWGSTYAIWPLLMLLIAALLTQVPNPRPPARRRYLRHAPSLRQPLRHQPRAPQLHPSRRPARPRHTPRTPRPRHPRPLAPRL